MINLFARKHEISYVLDTNVLIDLLHHNEEVVRHIGRVGVSTCAISVITLLELYRGAYSMNTEEGRLEELAKIRLLAETFEVLPVSAENESYAREWKRLRDAGTPIDDFDLIIGTSALENGYILVSNNLRHMQRIEGLLLEDWKI